MSFAAHMVHLDVARDCEQRVQLALDLAERGASRVGDDLSSRGGIMLKDSEIGNIAAIDPAGHPPRADAKSYEFVRKTTNS